MQIHFCPTRARLRQLMRGQLSLDKIPEIEEHVEKCPRCQQILALCDHLTDWLIESLQDYARTPLPELPPGLDRRLHLAQGIAARLWRGMTDENRLLNAWNFVTFVGAGETCRPDRPTDGG